jgi:ABC-type oligopeptide transport system substrate-binding subunit
MKKMRFITTIAGALLMLSVASAFATSTSTQVEFLVNGVSHADPLSTATGLGTRSFSFTNSGAYTVRSFFDLELSLATTGFLNEYGNAFNSPRAGQSWQIDEPGYTGGTIWDNFNGPGFNNAIGRLSPDDVAVGLAWDFILDPGYRATVSFTASNAAPSSASLFYLGQFDDAALDDSVYFYSNLLIEPNGPSTVPEPSTLILLGSALAGLALCRSRIRK